MTKRAASPTKAARIPDRGRLFAAEAAYADSMLRSALGDARGCIDALERALDAAPTYQCGRYADGLELYRRAVARFPRVAVFDQGVGCCAGHEKRHDEAIAASRAALALEPENQPFVTTWAGACTRLAGWTRLTASSSARWRGSDPRQVVSSRISGRSRACRAMDHVPLPQPTRPRYTYPLGSLLGGFARVKLAAKTGLSES